MAKFSSSVFNSSQKDYSEDTYPDYAAAQKEAEKIISNFAIKKAPIDPEEIAEDLGLKVVYKKFTPDVEKKISGFINMKEKKIYINKDISASRMVFTIAHELGHYILHKKYAESNNYKTFPRTDEHICKPPVEKEADAFAANLLVPLNLLKKYKNYASQEELADMFCVSKKVIEHRLKWVR